MNNEISVFIEYKNVQLQQNVNYQKPFIKLLNAIKPKRILEIGTGVGGFTLFLRDTLNEIGLNKTPIKTFDIYHRTDQFKDEHNLENIDFNLYNIFNDDYELEKVDEIKSFIQSEGITLVLCDGDSKVNEFKQLSPLLKIGDVIMAHDYIFNRQIFESDFFEKIWNWCEVTDEDINQTCSEQNLKDFMMEDFEKVVWVCKRKTDS